MPSALLIRYILLNQSRHQLQIKINASIAKLNIAPITKINGLLKARAKIMLSTIARTTPVQTNFQPKSVILSLLQLVPAGDSSASNWVRSNYIYQQVVLIQFYFQVRFHLRYLLRDAHTVNNNLRIESLPVDYLAEYQLEKALFAF